jgi:hypothetical protein
LEDCAAGREPRVIVNLPPGYMKSMLISIMYVAGGSALIVTAKFICIGYGDDLARSMRIDANSCNRHITRFSLLRCSTKE